MLKIAITGGIASGKSTVSNYIKELGYPVYDADEIYSELLKNEEIVLKICNLIGVKPKNADKKAELDRKAVSEKVFSDKDLLKKLNDYTHTRVYDEINKIADCLTDKKIVFFEIPLLFESKRENSFDKVIVVLRDKKERIKALEKRNGFNVCEAEKRIENQFDYDNFDLTKHTLIYNDGDTVLLKSKVLNVIESIEKEINTNF